MLNQNSEKSKPQFTRYMVNELPITIPILATKGFVINDYKSVRRMKLLATCPVKLNILHLISLIILSDRHKL